MSRVTLAIADTADGKIDFKITHHDGFVGDSRAHQLSMQICKWLDEQCTGKEEVKPEQATPEEALFVKRLQQPILIPR